MGVPITFLDKYCPEQFEIVGFAGGWNGKSQLILKNYNGTQLQHNKDLSVHEVSKLNDGTPLIKISDSHKSNTTFYENGGDFLYSYIW